MTQKELAKELNISTTALSFILNRKPGVSDATRDRVIAQLKEMGYGHLIKEDTKEDTIEQNGENQNSGTTSNPYTDTADSSASAASGSAASGSVASGSVAMGSVAMGTVAMGTASSGLASRGPVSLVSESQICLVLYRSHGLMYSQESPLYMHLMEQIEDTAEKYGYHVVLKVLNSSDDLDRQIGELKQSGISGALVFATEIDQAGLEAFAKTDLPVVLIDNEFQTTAINSVSIDNVLGTYQIVEYLYRMGHREIGYLKCSTTAKTYVDRGLGFQSALQTFGLELKEENIFRLPMNEFKACQIFEQFLEEHPDYKFPTIFITDDDLLATGVMYALERKHIRIPEDVSFIGFNNREEAKRHKPALTTISIPKGALGHAAVELLVEQINICNAKPEYYRSTKVLISTCLIERESVKRIVPDEKSE